MPTYRIYFSGLVQGVGFRATCQSLADQFPALTGEVCNLPDRRVRLIVRGPVEDVSALVARLHTDFPGYIHAVEQSEIEPGDEPLPEGLSGVRVTRDQ
jgi:acylphosphatase